MLFDTHAHLDDARFDEDRESVIGSLQNAGISLVVNVGADMEGSRASVALAERYDFIYASVGVHPDETGSLTEADMETLAQYAARPKVVAIGEIGLDYHKTAHRGRCRDDGLSASFVWRRNWECLISSTTATRMQTRFPSLKKTATITA